MALCYDLLRYRCLSVTSGRLRHHDVRYGEGQAWLGCIRTAADLSQL